MGVRTMRLPRPRDGEDWPSFVKRASQNTAARALFTSEATWGSVLKFQFCPPVCVPGLLEDRSFTPPVPHDRGGEKRIAFASKALSGQPFVAEVCEYPIVF